MDQKDLRHVKLMMKAKPEPIEKAGLFPNAEHFEKFFLEHPENIPFSKILNKFVHSTKFDDKYFMCEHDEKFEIAKLVDGIKLTFKERHVITLVPIDTEDQNAMSLLRKVRIPF